MNFENKITWLKSARFYENINRADNDEWHIYRKWIKELLVSLGIRLTFQTKIEVKPKQTDNLSK